MRATLLNLCCRNQRPAIERGLSLHRIGGMIMPLSALDIPTSVLSRDKNLVAMPVHAQALLSVQ